MVNTVAFPSLRSVTDDWAQLLLSAGRVTDHLPASYGLDATLYAGYAAQESQLLALLNRTDSPAYELMSTSWGQLAVSAMQPFSRGVVEARGGPESVFPSAEGEGPLIDPRYCSHPFDCEVLALGLDVNERLVRTEPMAALEPVFPDEPGLGEEGDDEDEAVRQELRRETVRRLIRTEFHPSGTAAMMPLDKGGVVDPSLRVHGTRNLRVVDAAVIPLIPDGHIQAVVYAIAEKVCLRLRVSPCSCCYPLLCLSIYLWVPRKLTGMSGKLVTRPRIPSSARTRLLPTRPPAASDSISERATKHGLEARNSPGGTTAPEAWSIFGVWPWIFRGRLGGQSLD